MPSDLPLPPIAEPWLALKTPQVRALAFAIGSAPLIQDWPNTGGISIELPDGAFWRQHLQRYWPRLLQLDRNPRPLQHALQVRPNIRLGHYFEDLLAFWLSDEGWHPFVLLGQGIQCMQGHRTIGEVDFLLKNLDTGEIEHWEVCLKFYLGEGLLRPAEWVGLQRQDSLGRKLHHLQQRQFSVQRIQGLTIDRRRAIVKGRLFWPLSSGCELKAMRWLNPNHLSGAWQSFVPSDHLPWRRAERLEWLVESQQHHVSATTPRYWCNGLYLHQDTHTDAQQRLMLRLDTPLIQPPYLLNTSTTQDCSQMRSDSA